MKDVLGQEIKVGSKVLRDPDYVGLPEGFNGGVVTVLEIRDSKAEHRIIVKIREPRSASDKFYTANISPLQVVVVDLILDAMG